jgi:uncharacterized protein YdeI (YjbR/CyaY-like superfamily)
MASSMKKQNTLTRDIHPMPAHIRKALTTHQLMDAYKERPPYQQNDYIGWITRAKLEATQQKRLNQMLEELKGGNRYMKMAWSGRRP